jgi:Flp pilus assembly pilin Flp
VEYALLVALIAVVLVGAVTFLGDTTDTSFSTADSSIRAASEAG